MVPRKHKTRIPTRNNRQSPLLHSRSERSCAGTGVLWAGREIRDDLADMYVSRVLWTLLHYFPLTLRMLTCFLIPGKPWLYDDSPSPDNPLRCIHADPDWTYTYYSNMSNAYARMARESATVMHKKKDYDNPPMDGIWGKTELPALRYKTDVKEVSYLVSQRPSPRQLPAFLRSI